MNKLLFILIAHMAGDYLFQSNFLALNKGKSNYILLAHSVLYVFAVILVGYLFEIKINNPNLIMIGGTHFFIDYLKAHKITVGLMGEKNALIFDQMLHYIILVLCL